MKLATLASAAAVLLSAFAGTASASGLRGVAVSDSLDYDENYYVPEDYDEDYDLDFEEEPLDLDVFDDEDLDDEDLDSDMELYRRFNGRFNGPRRFNGRFNGPRRFNGNLKNRAFRQLSNTGRINSNVVRRMNGRQVRRVVRAEGLSTRDVRINRSGDIVVRRGAQQWRPRRRNNRPFRRYYD